MSADEIDPRKKLAYDESIRALNLQSSALDDLRSRTGILLTAVSLTATFLGSKALDGGFTPWSDAGLGSFVLSGLFCLAILWPTGGWSFVFDARTILSGYVEGPNSAPLDQIYVEFSRINQDNWKANAENLTRLFWYFRLAVLALIAQLPCWLIAIGILHG